MGLPHRQSRMLCSVVRHNPLMRLNGLPRHVLLGQRHPQRLVSSRRNDGDAHQ
jgi:hypothetical protein